MQNLNQKLEEMESLKNSISEKLDILNPLQEEVDELEQKLRKVRKETEEEFLSENADLVKKLEDAGAEDIFVDWDMGDDEFEIVEDDGTLHINYGKVRGCFICNQEITQREWNKEAGEVFKALGLPVGKSLKEALG